MNVGIVTINDYTNYGNRLQNYALSCVLTNKFGAEVVSLVSVEEKRFYKRAKASDAVAQIYFIVTKQTDSKRNRVK